MFPETAGRKRSSSSESSSRRKKSQRLIINPPKAPRLILNPSKPQHQHQQQEQQRQPPNTVKMVIRPPKLPSSPSPEPERYDWRDTTLVGNGEDASYNYEDICKVQAVMKVFNGLSSATRKVEAAEEKKSNRDEPEDVAMTDPDSRSHLDDRTRAELEMNDILQEALDCHHCEKTMNLKPSTMETDILQGTYRCVEDPPFLLNQPSEDVAPDEMPEEVNEPGYLELATTAQQEQYLQVVEQYIARNRINKVFLGMESQVDQGYESKFAFYCMDYHIHQHYLHRRSILNYCRTNEEMEDVRYWRYKLALWTAQHNIQLSQQHKDTPLLEREEDMNELSVNTTSTTSPIQMIRKEPPHQQQIFGSDPFSSFAGVSSASPPSPTSSIFSSPVFPSSPSAASTAASSPPRASPFPNSAPPVTLPWPKQQQTLSNQINLHRHLSNPRERAARVRSVRKRFRDIMHKRAIQRRDGLIIADYEAAFSHQRWNRGRGPLVMQREGRIGELLEQYRR